MQVDDLLLATYFLFESVGGNWRPWTV